MTVTFNVPEWGTIDIPEAENEAEEKVLQAVIQAAGDADRLPEDNPMRAALKDLQYALEADVKGTSPNVARCSELVRRALWEVSALISEVSEPPMTLPQLYEDLFDDWSLELMREIPQARDRFRQAVANAEKWMDRADEELDRLGKPKGGEA